MVKNSKLSKLSPRAGARLLRQFRDDRKGNIAMLFALLSVPAISAVGMAVDLSRAYRVAALTQYSLDSAALAAGRIGQTTSTKTFSAAQTAATHYFEAAKPKDVISSAIALSSDSTNTTFTLTATSWVSTPFIGVLSRMFSTPADASAPQVCKSAFSCMKLTRSATASIGAGGNGGSNVEVSLMLDVTGSMYGSRLTTLKDAATDLIDTIIWTDQSRYTSKMAIAPFAENVYVGNYYTAVTNRTLSYNRHPCVVDRTGTHAHTDEAPASGSWIPRISTTTCNPNVAIVPLTANKTTLKSTITSLQASGGTAGALGTQWAWYLISPKWATIWGTASAPAPYADLTTLNSNGAPKLRKFAVLMTDGDYNYLSGESEWQSVVNAAALSTCTGMKNAGIVVYTVGFELTGTTAKTMLTSCASSSDKFYDATSEAALLAAFRDIALKISSLRLTH